MSTLKGQYDDCPDDIVCRAEAFMISGEDSRAPGLLREAIDALREARHTIWTLVGERDVALREVEELNDLIDTYREEAAYGRRMRIWGDD